MELRVDDCGRKRDVKEKSGCVVLDTGGKSSKELGKDGAIVLELNDVSVVLPALAAPVAGEGFLVGKELPYLTFQPERKGLVYYTELPSTVLGIVAESQSCFFPLFF